MPIYRSTIIFYGSKIKNEDRLLSLDDEDPDEDFNLDKHNIEDVDIWMGGGFEGTPVFLYNVKSHTEACDLIDNDVQFIRTANEAMPPINKKEINKRLSEVAKQFGLKIERPTWYICHDVSD